MTPKMPPAESFRDPVLQILNRSDLTASQKCILIGRSRCNHTPSARVEARWSGTTIPHCKRLRRQIKGVALALPPHSAGATPKVALALPHNNSTLENLQPPPPPQGGDSPRLRKRSRPLRPVNTTDWDHVTDYGIETPPEVLRDRMIEYLIGSRRCSRDEAEHLLLADSA